MQIIEVDTNENEREQVKKHILDLGILKKHVSSFNENHIQSAVLVPLFLKENELHILLTERTSNISIYAGEVCLPGGRRDGNEDFVQTALRESREEIDLSNDNIDVLGILGPLLSFRNTKYYEVHGVIGLIKHSFNANENKAEVGHIFSMPLKNFLTKSKFSVKHNNPYVDHEKGELPSNKVFKVRGMTYFLLYFFACEYYNAAPSKEAIDAIPKFNERLKSTLKSKL